MVVSGKASGLIRIGMVGGGSGAFIGEVHRIAMRIDGRYSLVCGAFSSSPARSVESARQLGVSEDRAYPDYKTMLHAENELPEEQRMQAVVIVTPNDMHLPVSVASLEAGFDVICDKPATRTLPEALELKKAIDGAQCRYMLTHTYLGYPMVSEAQALVAAGKLGEIRRVVVQYPQDWLANPVEVDGQKQAAWRTDPERSGPSGCFGDIGTHAFNLAETITRLKVSELCADLHTHVPGRLLEDDGAALLKFENGARGVLMASQISTGEENGLRIEVFGEKAGLSWRQEEPNTLWYMPLGEPHQRFRAGGEYLSDTAQAACRTPAGHPEGYLEAFANLYARFADAHFGNGSGTDLPGIADGLRGMAFLETALASSKAQAWKSIPTFSTQ